MTFLKLHHSSDEMLRTEIIRTSLKMNALGINQGKSGNVSARLNAPFPGQGEGRDGGRIDEVASPLSSSYDEAPQRRDGFAFLITPAGIPYEQTKPQQIVAMRMDGTCDGDILPSSEWRFHRDIYAARRDVNAIVHTHAPYATTLACMDRDIPPFHYMVAIAGGKNIRCAPYATFGSQELSSHAVTALQDRRACLLSHHGMIACDTNLENTLALAVETETLARMYWQALQIGEPTLLSDAEITLEANPGTVEAKKFEGFRAAGINRISIGIQSFADDKLKALGRIHSADEARRAIEMAQQHFDNINLDLMYALPQQTLQQTKLDIDTAISFGTTHLSAYHLTLEPNTAFHHSPPPLPDDDLSADMQELIETTLASAGFEHYETSAFAKKNHRCRHNLNYWNFGDYLGIGAGAHGKLTSHTGVVREVRRKHPRDYLQAAARGEFAIERRDVTAHELPFEFMMNALRLCEGFPTRLYQERTGLALAGIQGQLLAAQRDGLLEATLERIAPTQHGQRFLNALLRRFLPDA